MASPRVRRVSPRALGDVLATLTFFHCPKPRSAHAAGAHLLPGLRFRGGAFRLCVERRPGRKGPPRALHRVTGLQLTSPPDRPNVDRAQRVDAQHEVTASEPHSTSRGCSGRLLASILLRVPASSVARFANMPKPSFASCLQQIARLSTTLRTTPAISFHFSGLIWVDVLDVPVGFPHSRVRPLVVCRLCNFF